MKIQGHLKSVFVGIILSLYGASAQAGYASFSVDPVSFKVLTKNFKVLEMSAFLACVFTDNSMIFKSYPEKELKLTYKEIENNTDEAGALYQVEIEGGKFSAWKPLLDPYVCKYLLNVTDADLSDDWHKVVGSIGLVDSRDDEYQNQKLSPARAFIADREISHKINTRYQPLKLEENKGFVERVK